jgi:glycosyltransferase involved in cell wall biosynthesis
MNLSKTRGHRPNNERRIALFLPMLRGGGAERVIAALAGGFAERGFTTDLVLGRAEGPYLSEVSPRVRIVDLKCRRTLSAILPLAKYLRREKPEAMLSSLDDANLIALWAKRLSGVSVRTVIREANTMSRVLEHATGVRTRLLPFLTRRFISGADAVVAVSQGVADDMVGSLGVSTDRVQVIYNPVITERLFSRSEEAVRHPWFANGMPPVIIGVGRLNRQKDFGTLIRAFAVVRRSRDVRLAILGDGEERLNLEKLAGDMGVDGDVWMPGFVDNPFPYMAQSSVFALSSAWEGLPNVLIQAMAVGTPVVAADCKSGPREILENGRHGILLPVGDHEALAAAIDETLSRGSARSDVLPEHLKRFELNAIVSQYLDVMLGEDGMAARTQEAREVSGVGVR